MSECCNTTTESQTHPDHNELIPRLNRIRGQIEGVVNMIGERRYCVEILTQVTAIQSALRAFESKLLERHLVGCLQKAVTNGDSKDAEVKVKEMVRFFEKRLK